MVLMRTVEIAFGVAVGIAEFNGEGVACCRGKRDDVHLLHVGVHHGVVDEAAHTVVDGDAHIAEALVKADVDGIVAGAGYDGVGANVVQQIT